MMYSCVICAIQIFRVVTSRFWRFLKILFFRQPATAKSPRRILPAGAFACYGYGCSYFWFRVPSWASCFSFSLAQIDTSTRRFCCLPASVPLSATDWVSPSPRVPKRFLVTLLLCRKRVTASDRFTESVWLYSCVPVLSVWPSTRT